MPRRAPFESLPLQPLDPLYSAWGLWGDHNELGRLNLLTPAIVKAASEEVKEGLAIPLE